MLTVGRLKSLVVSQATATASTVNSIFISHLPSEVFENTALTLGERFQ